mgnify:CR=1 FL=1
MGKNPNYSLLPNGALLKIFQYSKLEDLYNLQQTCPKFQQLIEGIKRTEIEDDWRLNFLKYEKFGTEISATGAIKTLELAKKKNGEKYSLNGLFVSRDVSLNSSIGDWAVDADRYYDRYHNIAIFTEVEY